MIGSFTLLLICIAALVYLIKMVAELLNEIDDNLHGHG